MTEAARAVVTVGVGVGGLLRPSGRRGVRAWAGGAETRRQVVLPPQQPPHPGMSPGVGWSGLSPRSAAPTPAADAHPCSRHALSPSKHD